MLGLQRIKKQFLILLNKVLAETPKRKKVDVYFTRDIGWVYVDVALKIINFLILVLVFSFM